MALLIGKQAPAVSGQAVINGNDIVDNFSLEQYKGKYVVLFFYPADFTFVCPTEIIAFQEKIAEFEARNCAVIGASTDSQFSHWKWLQTPQNEGGIKGVKFPLYADQSLMVSRAYDVLAGSEEYDENGDIQFVGVPQAYRGLFLIDREGVVRHQLVNDMPIGRSVEEILRVIDAPETQARLGEANGKLQA